MRVECQFPTGKGYLDLDGYKCSLLKTHRYHGPHNSLCPYYCKSYRHHPFQEEEMKTTEVTKVTTTHNIKVLTPLGVQIAKDDYGRSLTISINDTNLIETANWINDIKTAVDKLLDS